MAEPILTLREATVGYPGHPVLRDVTLDVFRGQSIAVVGPNGSGKTAFLKTVAGILRPLAGEVRLHTSIDGRRGGVGYVPQRATVSSLLPLTVYEVVEMGTYESAKPWRRVDAQAKERIAWALEEVGVTELARKAYTDLSGGQQQRVLIARALATNPAILVMDEPLASLDRDSVRSMVVLLARLRSEEGLTMLWADHFVPALREVVRDVMLIEDARLIWSRIEVLLDRERRLLAPSEATQS